MNVFYGELAEWWPLISPVEDYAEEADEIARVLADVHPAARTLLELGSGGGHNAFHLKRRYALTLTDLSEAMLRVSTRLNPESEHIVADMRTLDLGRTFDVVLAHDAIDYMTTEADLASAFATAHRHCTPGGVALFLPDVVCETFEPETDCGGADADDGRGVRYLEWTFDPDPADTVGVVEYVFLVRSADGATRSYRETHAFGLFPRSTWVRLLEAAGFDVEVLTERTSDARTPRLFFVGRRRA